LPKKVNLTALLASKTGKLTLGTPFMPDSPSDQHFETPWLKLLSRPFNANGDRYHFLSLQDYICLLAILDDKEILLVKQYRAAIDRVSLELPAGLVEKDETPEQCAIRECREETGYEPKDLELIFKGRVDPGRLDNHLWAYFSNSLSWNPMPKPEEDLICVKMSLSDFQASIDRGEFSSIPHLLTWFWAKEKGLIPKF